MTDKALAWKDMIHTEIEKGGGFSPCPFCKVPRSRRSDYIRCSRCGVNWITGENLGRDPRVERMEKFLADLKATAKPKEAKP